MCVMRSRSRSRARVCVCVRYPAWTQRFEKSAIASVKKERKKIEKKSSIKGDVVCLIPACQQYKKSIEQTVVDGSSQLSALHHIGITVVGSSQSAVIHWLLASRISAVFSPPREMWALMLPQ